MIIYNDTLLSAEHVILSCPCSYVMCVREKRHQDVKCNTNFLHLASLSENVSQRK